MNMVSEVKVDRRLFVKQVISGFNSRQTPLEDAADWTATSLGAVRFLGKSIT
jgi:hypothetical protein